MWKFSVVCVLAWTSIASASDEDWYTLPTTRLAISLNAERATATTLEGTNYDLTSAGFGVEAGYYLRLGMFQPFFVATLDSNIKSADDPCKPSPFDPDTLLCEDTGSPLRVLGAARAGLRVVIPSDGEPGKFGISAGGQYLVQGIYVNDDGSNPNEILPYGELEYTGGRYVLAGAAGFGGYFKAEVAMKKDISIFDTLILRLERLDWERTGSVVKSFDFHIAIGSLSWM